MLAELYGKFDAERPEGADRSEDLLTSAVFGALRHLPRRALGAVLDAIGGIDYDRASLKDAQILLWPHFPMPLWQGVTVEPDVIIKVGHQTIVFEAKLYSPFRMYPDRRTPHAPQVHQLAVEYLAVKAWAAGEKRLPPVVVAVTSSAQPPDRELRRASSDVMRLAPSAASVTFRWLPWWRIAETLERFVKPRAGAPEPVFRIHELALVGDLLQYMDKKGVFHVFKGFKPEDYWLVAAAQRVAAERVYPQIRAFVEDLAAVLSDDDILWSTPAYQSMWMPGGTHIKKPGDWTRGWIGVVFWPKSWPKRQGNKLTYNGLYVLFDFINAKVEVGLNIPGPGVALAQHKWPTTLPALVAGLKAIPKPYELVSDTGDVANPGKRTTTDVVDQAWFASVIPSLVGTAHLRLCRTTEPLAVTVSEVRELMLELRADVDQIGDALWELLRSVNFIE